VSSFREGRNAEEKVFRAFGYLLPPTTVEENSPGLLITLSKEWEKTPPN